MIAWIASLRGHWLAIAATLIFGALCAGRARADTPPAITTRASADQVEVGEPFSIELKALVEQGSATPSDPALRLPAGFSGEGPMLSTQTIINGFGARAQVRIGIGATWTLVGQRPGRYTIPAPTVVWNGRRLAGTPIAIEVVPSTGRSRRRGPSNPFLMPGGPGFNFPWPFGNDMRDDDEPAPTAPELSLPRAPDRIAFVRAKVDKTHAVVGEQVTITFYTYTIADHSGRMQLTAWHEAPLADFVRVPLRKNPGTEPAVLAMAGGKRYVARLFDRVAIFPVKAGDLHTGSLRISFAGTRIGRIGDRESEDLVIHVSEPPLAGRPAGYQLGDVGQMTLAATVQPRRIDQGGSVAVTLRIAGTGNLPQSLRLPERTGIEWLDPEKKDAIEPQNSVVQGTRTFGYVVKVADSGTVDLGEVTIPYWDPAAKKYQVARATLGTVEVKPIAPPLAPSASGSAAPVDDKRAEPFAAMPRARATLGAYTEPTRSVEGRSLWLLIVAPPLLVGMVTAGSSAFRRTRARRSASSSAPAALAAKAMREAAEAEAKGDAKGVAAAIDRAVHLAIEGATGLKSRGVLLADLPDEIDGRGAPRALGEAAASVLAASEAVRFEPTTDAEGARDLAKRARDLVADLAKHGAS